MPKKFDPEVRDRAMRMVLDRVEEAGSITKAVALVAPKVDVGRETPRRWVSQHRVDAGLTGPSTRNGEEPSMWFRCRTRETIPPNTPV